MPAGKGRPLNKGQRVLNRMNYGDGSSKDTGVAQKGEIKNGKSNLRTARAASEWDKAWKGKEKPMFGASLKTYNYGPGKKKGK